MDKFNRFRNENPVFIYDSYSFSVTQNTVEVSYRFVIPGLAEFTRMELPFTRQEINRK